MDRDHVGPRVIEAENRGHQQEQAGMRAEERRRQHPLAVDHGQEPGEMHRIIHARASPPPPGAQLPPDEDPGQNRSAQE